MTIEKAIEILDPDSELDVNEIITEVSNMTNQEAFDAGVSMINEACRLACKVMRQYLNDQVFGVN